MAKFIKITPNVIKATINDYPVIQNMARFYFYDLSRYCGFISEEWACPPDGLYSDVDLKHYFEDKDRLAYLIKIDSELAGFALLHHGITSSEDVCVMAEFFILAKFQGQGIGREVAEQLWIMHPGKWEIPIIPENSKALSFWRKIVSSFTNGHYSEELRNVDYDKNQPKRYILSFDTVDRSQSSFKNIPHGTTKKQVKIEVDEVNHDQAEKLCRDITTDLPEYFGISSANEAYFKGVHRCKNLAAKINGVYVGLLSLNFPYANNSSIYWMGVLKEHQKKGIGSALLNAACTLAIKASAVTMTVETLDPDHADENYLKTYQFYKSVGFQPLVTVQPQGYEWTMVYMVKPLNNALCDLLRLEEDARQFGFEWPDELMIVESAIDECREIRETIENNEGRDRLQEEVGDLLHSGVSLCVFAGFDVNETLAKVNNKFGNRMQIVKKLSHELQLPNLKGQSISFMLELWRKAKNMASEK